MGLNDQIKGSREGRYAFSVILLLLLLLPVQIVAGPLPIELFRFPLNVLFLLIWLGILVELYRRRHKSPGVQWLLSMPAARLSLLFLAGIGLLFGLQAEPATTSWPVVGMLLFVQSTLALTIGRVWMQRRSGRGLFLLSHAGLWLALVGAFWGAPDREQLRVVVDREAATREAYRPDGRLTALDCELRLRDFRITTYADGTPSFFEAEVEIDGEAVSLRVNHPHRRTLAESIYLISYDRTAPTPRYCIVEVVREPWRGVTTFGIWMMILGALVSFFSGRRSRPEPVTESKNE